MLRVARTLVIAGIAAVAAGPALSMDGRFMVTDLQICGMIAADEDWQEVGMVLSPDGMFTIEYYCEFATPIDLDAPEDIMQTRAGFCAEPGFVLPTVFVAQTIDAEAGHLRIWQQGQDTPTEFLTCPNF